ncbi:hypothetical protein AV530_018190 [Patagioenas fasciata monilis]|uniref:Uncharacterized protein n=1 Tax=Patagioenas fasciata monilis TaxID=372326 RepID=A0A1V4KL68_PATFA|nr:hypothetical protein AV530_018190 [Patagioenas fasciata monilis]
MDMRKKTLQKSNPGFSLLLTLFQESAASSHVFYVAIRSELLAPKQTGCLLHTCHGYTCSASLSLPTQIPHEEH